MRHLFYTLICAVAIFSTFSCGNREQEKLRQKQIEDSISMAKADSIAKIEAMAKAKADSIAKAKADSLEKINNPHPDLKLFDLRGPVKAVFEYGTKIYGFSKNGTYQIQSDAGDITRDNYGRMTKVETYSGPYAKYWSIEYIYDDEGRLSKTIDSDGNSEEFTYNSKGLVSSSTSDYNGSCSYTYTQFDKYGNWIRRTAKTEYGTNIETRTITYY